VGALAAGAFFAAAFEPGLPLSTGIGTSNEHS